MSPQGLLILEPSATVEALQHPKPPMPIGTMEIVSVAFMPIAECMGGGGASGMNFNFRNASRTAKSCEPYAKLCVYADIDWDEVLLGTSWCYLRGLEDLRDETNRPREEDG